MATKKKELSSGKEMRWINEELLRTECLPATVLASEEGFLVDLETRALKKILKNKIFEHIKRKSDKSLKNQQVKEKIELELGKTKLKRCVRIDARPREKIRLVRLVFTQMH